MDQPLPGGFNMARDYALLKSLSRGDAPPTLRLYGWNNPAITIGYFQRIEEELAEEECRKDGINIIRRITGGGAVFHQYEITYSTVIPLHGTFVPGSITDSYTRICKPLVRALGDHGINAVFKPINDVTVGGRKISGSAQTRRDGVLLQHGTLLLDVDAPAMFRYLSISDEKKKHIYENPQERVIAVRELLGDRAMTVEFNSAFKESLARGFAEEFNVTFSLGQTTAEEDRETADILPRMFGNDQWNRYRKTAG